MQEQDDYGFWSDDGWSRVRHVDRRPAATKNPMWARLGALVALGVLALPVAAVMNSSSSDSRTIEPNTEPVGSQLDPASVADSDVAIVAVPDTAFVEPTAAAATDSVAPPTAAPIVADVASAAPTAAAPPALQAAPKVETVKSTTKPATGTTKKLACQVSYKPVQGDYWILVAKKVSVTLKSLLQVNGATTDTPIYPGRTICLPANASTPTTAVAKAPATTPKPTQSTAKVAPTPAKPTPTTAKPTPTTAKPTPTTAKPPPPRVYTRAEVTQIIRDVWPDDLEDEAIRIATRESNLVPTARNSCCYGLFQIYYEANKKSLNGWGVTSASMLFDPKVNAFAAYAMYARGGWGPWQ